MMRPGLDPQTAIRLLAREKPLLKMLPDAALNGETPVDLLADAVTPSEHLFVRCNGLVPAISAADRAAWTLDVDGEVGTPLRLDMAGLAARYPAAEMTAVLECAGNGRSFFGPEVDGLPWGLGAVGCARWSGVRLADVLAEAGVSPSAVYAAFESADRQVTAPERPAFSRGLPIGKALAPETLIATHLNGQPLPVLHGGPLRIVAPGFPGAAWQKWVTRIWVRDREHDGEKMTGTNYRINGAVIADLSVKSLITAPLHGFMAEAGKALEVTGFAWSGHTPVVAVAISGDGATWASAALEAPASPFGWRRFTAVVYPERGPVTISARATDAEGRTQPRDNPPFNPKGYGNNRIHTVAGAAR
jgi:DMSO/TMAO reductase YedYZ molybdopterin-dependent catalytic subunit